MRKAAQGHVMRETQKDRADEGNVWMVLWWGKLHCTKVMRKTAQDGEVRKDTRDHADARKNTWPCGAGNYSSLCWRGKLHTTTVLWDTTHDVSARNCTGSCWCGKLCRVVVMRGVLQSLYNQTNNMEYHDPDLRSLTNHPRKK